MRRTTEHTRGAAGADPPEATTQALHLEAPPPRPSRGALDGLQRGDTLGRYVLLSPLGSGAMGVVYSAFDPELSRIVAVKVVRGEYANDPIGRQRFLREAQALAQLSHPNVVAVHDVGSLPDGIFLAMEYVAGQTLHAWLNEAPRSQKDILRIFRGAGAGLSAAHAEGIVHRDFKPGNVLLGQDGRPRVVDFGLARRAPGACLEPPTLPAGGAALDVELTFPGQLLGTPRYMAPEQAQGGEVGPATDQFAFCVALYVALYGEPPFDDHELSPHLMLALKTWHVRSAPKASRVPLRLRRALLRGLSVDPQNRFESIDALLDELDHDPARSRRLWLAGGLAAAVGAALGIGLSARASGRDALCSGAERHLADVWSAPRRDALRDALLATPLPFAKDTWARLEPVLNGYASKWAASHVEACRATRVRGEQSEHMLDLRMACLHRRRGDLKALTDLLLANPEGAAESAVQAAYGLGNLGACDDVQALSQPVQPPPDAAARAEVEALSVELSQVKALREAGRYKEGFERATGALSRAQRLGYKPSEAQALLYFGSFQRRLGDATGAEQTFLEAAAAAVAGRDDATLAHAAQALSNCVGYRQRRFHEGLTWAKVAKAAAERQGEDRLLLSTIVNVEGLILQERHQYDDARAHFARAFELLRSEAGIEHPDALFPLYNLARLDARLRQYDEAYARILEVSRLREKLLGPVHPVMAETLNMQGVCEIGLARYDDAAASLARALAIQEAVLGASSMETALTLQNIAEVNFYQGRDAEALTLYQRARGVFEKKLPAKHPFFEENHLFSGAIHLRAGRFGLALRELESARAVLRANGGDPGDRGTLELTFASALYAAGDRKKARSVAQKARSELPANEIAMAETWLTRCGLAAPPPGDRY